MKDQYSETLFFFQLSDNLTLENETCHPKVIKHLYDSGYIRNINAIPHIEDEYIEPEYIQGLLCSKSFSINHPTNNTQISPGTIFFYNYNTNKISFF